MKKKIPLMLISVIVLLTSFLGATGGRGGFSGGGGFRGVGGGGVPSFGFGGGNTGGAPGGMGYTTPPGRDPNLEGHKGGTFPVAPGTPPFGKVFGGGYKGGDPMGKPQPGGDTGNVIIRRPKPPEDDPPKKAPRIPMPQQCKPEVRYCINRYIYGGVGRPKYHGECCLKLKHSVKCVCKFLKTQDVDLRNGAYGILKGCHYRLRKPCPK